MSWRLWSRLRAPWSRNDRCGRALAGYAAAARFAAEHANGARVWAVEGAGHYGAGLARYLSGRGETVLEVGRVPRDERRLRGKNDPLDAIRAARTVPVQRLVDRCSRFRRASSAAPDDQLNRALHTVILHRRQHDPATKAYIERRIAEGKTRREATRLLKRYLARHLYRSLQTSAGEKRKSSFVTLSSVEVRDGGLREFRNDAPMTRAWLGELTAAV